eukprot:7090050-Prymnesium_polylepis.1
MRHRTQINLPQLPRAPGPPGIQRARSEIAPDMSSDASHAVSPRAAGSLDARCGDPHGAAEHA